MIGRRFFAAVFGGALLSAALVGASSSVVLAASTITLTPPSANFGNQNVGSVSAEQVFTVTNTGASQVTVTAVGIGGTNPSDFSVGAETCTAAPIDPAGMCTIPVSFAPTATGSRSGTLSVTSDAIGSPHTAALSGTGTQPALTLDPPSVDFGQQGVGTTSPDRTVNVRNTGTGPLTVTAEDLLGPNAADYLVDTENCRTAPVPPSGACSVQLNFTPSAGGARTASLSVSSDAPGSPHASALSGTGIGSVTLSPSSVSFPAQQVGTQSPPQTVTLTVTGPGPVTVATVGFANPAPNEYVMTSENCTTAGPIPHNGTCAIQVSFAPTASGTRTDTLVVNDDAPDAPHSAPLTGLGVANPCDPAAPRPNEIFWVNTGSGDWYTAANWSGGVLPSSTSDVCVNPVGITVTYGTGDTSVHSLRIKATLAVTGGTLSTAAQSVITGTLNLSGGRLNRADVLDVTTFNWTGGTLGGAGSTSTGGLSITGAYGKVLAEGTLTNTANAPLSGGPLYVSEYSRTATFSNTASGVVDLQSDLSFYNNGGTASLSNVGTLKKSAGTGTTMIGVALNNTGVVQALSGMFSFADVTNGGQLTPTSAPNAVTLNTYAQTAGGTLNLKIGGTASGCTSIDKLSVSGAASLAGTLNLTVSGCTPTHGQSFLVLTTSARTGTFATVSGPAPGFTASYTATSVNVVAN